MKLFEIKLPRRYQGDVGKAIGGAVYVHKMYADEIVPEDTLQHAMQFVGDFDYDVVKWDKKTNNVTFISSPDFNRADEPTVGPSLLVKPDGTTKQLKAHDDPWIYHHKWLFVRDDYPGFDVERSKERSIAWMQVPDIDYTRIGKQSFWKKNVVPKVGR